jgi:threonine dehydrogenase-like Zn-dependent dehydrogenase
VKALQIRRNIARLGMARMVAGISGATAARLGPLEYRTIDPPVLPGPGWQRVTTSLAGICGSDLSLVQGHASTYFEHWVSFPFVPGHEVVGTLDDGTRVVLEPVLGHCARGAAPPFEGAAPGDGDDYAHLVTCGDAMDLEPGIQTGFCASTGGGWSPQFVAHESQLHPIPDEVSDEQAVLIEPLAGGLHAALKTLPIAQRARADGTAPIVAVLGAGTMGLAAIAGLRRYVPDVRIISGARYGHQRSLALEVGADLAVAPDELSRAVRRMSGGHVIGDALSSGAHATIDAVGTSASIGACLAMTRPRGRVVLLGMPADVSLDLTGLWHRETELVGAYTYGTEHLDDGTVTTTFALAIDTAAAIGAHRLLSATYRLEDHVQALRHAAEAGRRGGVKIAFDLRHDPSPTTKGDR